MPLATRFLSLIRPLRRDTSGAIAVLIALLLMVAGVIASVMVDMARLESARGRLQNAADIALKGGLSTMSTIDLQQEAQRIFSANFPAGTMSVTQTPVRVQKISPDTYELAVDATVKTVMWQYIRPQSVNLAIRAKGVRGFAFAPQMAEIVLALSNAGTMATKMDGLKAASRGFVDVVFGDSANLARVSLNVVPFDVGVNIGSDTALRATRSGWMQEPFHAAFESHGIAANRNSDNPPNTISDFSDAAPLAATTAFRVPTAANVGDVANTQLAPLAFGISSKQGVYDALAKMRPTGQTRSNVGVQWAWMTLSPSWKGLWDAARPELPRALPSAKTMVLVVDSGNTIYRGGTSNDDDNTTLQLCGAMKAQGMIIYTLSFGTGSVNEALMQACATSPSYYLAAPKAEDLLHAMRAVADRLAYDTIRIIN